MGEDYIVKAGKEKVTVVEIQDDEGMVKSFSFVVREERSDLREAEQEKSARFRYRLHVTI